MSYNSPEVVILSIEHPQLHDKALKWVEGCDNVTEGVKVKVEQCDYNEAPQKLDTDVSKLICTVSDHREEVWLILNEDNPDQTTEEGRKPASLPQSATATYKTIGGQPGNGDLILDRSTVSIAKKTYNDEIANEAGIARIFEAAKSSNSVIVHAPLHLMRLAFWLVIKVAEGMSPELIFKPEDFGLVENPLSQKNIGTTIEDDEWILGRSALEPCNCAEERRAEIVENGVRGKQIEAVFSRFKTEETHGAQPYEHAGLKAGYLRAQNALEKVCPAQLQGLAPRCKSMAVGIENFIWTEDQDPPTDQAIVVVLSGDICVSKLTKGVTVQEAYVRRAKSFGYTDIAGKCGQVTVGTIINAHTGYSKDNWHRDIIGVDRFSLHQEALGEALDQFKKRQALKKEKEALKKEKEALKKEKEALKKEKEALKKEKEALKKEGGLEEGEGGQYVFSY
ncbi:hypothetical protein BM221_005904 [Beauveria bassiana]|uniref:Uncharacterized protein n=1 Tax=Beauveria bassiana TaxID=176275 RepID=A0A2N6NKH5_BEABA|nr:hypothetical protein BM221_005904 [Beauveria bassiana]